MKFTSKTLSLLLLAVTTARAELTVSVASVKTTGRKAVLTLALTNSYPETVESARATVFLLDAVGKVVGQNTRWIIGGSPEKSGLGANGGTSFNFVVEVEKPFTANRVFVNRVVVSGGRVITPASAPEIRGRK